LIDWLGENEEEIGVLLKINSDGMINYTEFTVAAINLKQNLRDKYLKAAFNALDFDGNGEICLNEFKQLF
jgi:Ca2+-binding EF-hand superfamily protein